MISPRILLLFAISAMSLPSCSHQAIKSKTLPAPPSLTEQVRAVLSAKFDSLFTELTSKRDIAQRVEELYKSSGYKPLWITDRGVSSSCQELIGAIADSEMNGLDSKSYFSDTVLDLFNKIEPIDLTNAQSESQKENLAHLDVVLTLALLSLASDIRFGKMDPRSVDPEWYVPRETSSNQISTDIEAIANPKDLRSFINSLYPAAADYARLREVLKSLKALRRIGGWAILPSELKLKPGDRDAIQVPLLRARLYFSHDLLDSQPEGESDLFDFGMETGLRNFQLRHGLDPNGVLNSETIRELNVPIEDRIRQIEVNMERWRWLPQDLGNNYVVVNVADYRLSIVVNQHVFNSMNVVVGQEFRRTPSFSSEIVAIELNPKWIVPQKLVKEDLLPILRSNPQTRAKKGFRFYSRKTGIEVDPATISWKNINDDPIPYRVIQDSGPLNALGKMKFWLPNQFGIFLHDTPARDLFEKKVRTFSSGCIRIEKPFDLADYLLRDDAKWHKMEFTKRVFSGVNRTIGIKPHFPIYLLYWTAWVDENGTINFRPDIYGRNWELDKNLRSVSE